jgi:hypothetical protein
MAMRVRFVQKALISLSVIPRITIPTVKIA